MAAQDEPLYDFPEPVQPSQKKFQGHQRTRGSLRSISVLDRLLLTVPVWLQLSINPATALHILQREPPGTFMVRKSRTSQKNVLCVRLADDSVPSFVRQFGIREEQGTLSLETSAISFPDLPRLISFYCVSRDVLPFPLELPDAIARATSHKELESISHMGVEFWNSHLNVRGPREAPKPEDEADKKLDSGTAAPPTAPAQPGIEATPQPESDQPPKTETDGGDATKQPENQTLFNEFCPITTRSPGELDYGIGLGALCFINPLFLQSQSALSRKRLLKRSLKVRVSMETSSMLSPPLAPPPPPPLMPKKKKGCRIQKQGPGGAPPGKDQPQSQSLASQASTQDTPTEAQAIPSPPEELENQPPAIYRDPAVQLPTVMEHLQEDSDYMQPPPAVNFSCSPSLSPYNSPAAAPPLFLKPAPPISPCPIATPSLSPYQSPVLAPFPLSPSASSPPSSPKVPLSLSPFTTSPFSQLEEGAYHTPALIPLRAKRQSSEPGAVEKGVAAEGNKEEGGERNEEMYLQEEEVKENEKLDKKEEGELVLQMSAACLVDTDSCSSFSSLEGAAETPPDLLLDQNNSSKEIT